MVDQLYLFSFSSSNGNFPYVGNTEIPYESVGMGIFKEYASMGTFNIPPLHVHSVTMILDSIDPWVIPSEDQIDSFGATMPLIPLEINYLEIFLALMAASEHYIFFSVNLDTYVPSPWLGSWDYPDPLNEKFPTKEDIVEVMLLEEFPWNNLHHHSSFLPCLDKIPSCPKESISHPFTTLSQIPVQVHEI